MKTLTWLLTGLTLALGAAACAPVDPPPPLATPTTAAKEPVAAPTLLPTSASSSGLEGRLDAAIDQVRQRDLLTTNGFWTVFHGILGLGPSITLRHPQLGLKVNALGYVASGGQVRGLEFIPTEDGLDVRTGPTFVGQGHQDQFIAEMAQWTIPIDKRFVVQGKDYTFMDFIRHTKARARITEQQELSWAILVLGQYLGTDLEWTNRFGEKLRFENVVSYELDQPIDSAACGGTHRLFGLTWVYHLHLRKGGPKTGVWKDVADKQARYWELARKTQNPDGSFSTNFFRGPGNAPDMQLRMNTTGHIFEWLALSLPQSELRKPWVENAANALALMFFEIQGQSMEGGTMYHAVHGLLIYHARVFGGDKLGAMKPPVPLPPDDPPLRVGAR